MVGTGVFTSLGFQAAGISNGFSIILLWVIGALVAFLGALCYAEIGAMFPRSGGEYNYLSRLYHPAIGFAAGWVSITVGFAAPVAAAAIALGEYAKFIFPSVGAVWIGAITVICISLIHSFSLSAGSKLQNYSTTFKVIAIVMLIILGIFSPHDGTLNLHYNNTVISDINSSAFATSFFFVSLAYSGWNAAGYIASEIDKPVINLPKSLLIGTAIVGVLYISLNLVFIKTIPLAEMSTANGPVVDIASVSAKHILGNTGGKIMSTLIAILLISTISAMIIAGPRVSQTMGEDNKLFSFLSKKNSRGIPSMAIVIQAIISLFFIFTASFSEVIIYISFTLSLFTFLAVAGLIYYRIKYPNFERPYKTKGYPWVPLLFLFFVGWLGYIGFKANLKESVYGLITAASGVVIYFLSAAKKPLAK
jgi:APA family basic amino acid/polyamine antiporter